MVKEIRGIYFGLKAALSEVFLITYAKVFGYFKHIDKLSIYNWDKAAKGDFTYLYKHRIKSVPRFFKRWFMELFYQLKKVKMDGFVDTLNLAYLKSIYVTSGNPLYLNKARSLEAKIANEEKVEAHDLDDMINLIEETFKSIGSIDVHKMSTMRFYSLYHRAIEKMKEDGVN